MLETIEKSYKLLVKKIPYLAVLLFILMIYEFLNQKAFDSVSKSQLAIYGLLFLGPIVYASIELVIYKHFMKVDFGRALGFIKKMALFIILHLIYGFVFMAPVFLIRYLCADHCAYWMPISLVVNIFVAFWLLARMSLIFPMIVDGAKITPKILWTSTKGSYLSWVMVATLIYFPYILSYYMISNIWVNMALSSSLSMSILLFNTVYYQTKIKNKEV